MYYLIIIQNDSTQAIYAHNTFDSALSAFHSELAYRAEDRNKTVCVILDAYGGYVKSETYEKETETEEE